MASAVQDLMSVQVGSLLPALSDASRDTRDSLAAAGRVAAELAWEDLCALATRDAAARGDPGYVYSSYASFQAVLVYRVAHEVMRVADAWGELNRRGDQLRTAARRLSEDAKVLTGVEIHPAAVIGHRFVVDHGFGTVIGEQTIIGDDCYLLQGVVLGGPSIGHSSAYRDRRRHPRIGNRVEIGGCVTVFGPVTIGDDCRLEPGVRVTFDVPAGARIRLVSTTQVCLSPAHVEVHAVSAVPGGLLVEGTGLGGLQPALLTEDHAVMSFLPVTTADDRSIRCGPPPVRTANARLLGLFAETTLACYVGGANALRML